MKLCFNLINSIWVAVFIIFNVKAEVEKLKTVLKDNHPIEIADLSTKDAWKISNQWPFGIVPYYVATDIYDIILHKRIQKAMHTIESISCIIFKEILEKPQGNFTWLHFTNPMEVRNCEHEIKHGGRHEIIVVIGFECMKMRDILHAVLHGLGFNDEVTHPHRDHFVRIVWANIQPQYRHLFRTNYEKLPHKLVEYDPMSIMHFHDRAYSANGGVTIAPMVPGMVINPLGKLSPLDVMKLHMSFSHECNKRKVDELICHCKKTFYKQNRGSMEESKEHDTGHKDKKGGKTSGENEEYPGTDVKSAEITPLGDEGISGESENVEKMKLGDPNSPDKAENGENSDKGEDKGTQQLNLGETDSPNGEDKGTQQLNLGETDSPNGEDNDKGETKGTQQLNLGETDSPNGEDKGTQQLNLGETDSPNLIDDGDGNAVTQKDEAEPKTLRLIKGKTYSPDFDINKYTTF